MYGDFMRINKFLAEAGVCSRRQADKLIQSGRVLIEGRVAGLGDQVLEGQRVICDGEEVIASSGEKSYIALNKPYGVITTMSSEATNTVMDYVDVPERVFPVGRLDVNSTGLLILTNDGEVSNQLSKAASKVEKEYLVVVDKAVSDNFLSSMASGVELEEGVTLPTEVEKHGPKGFKIVLVQGWNRQIRRMCEKFGYQVISLRRIRFGKLELGDLEVGSWRYVELSDIL